MKNLEKVVTDENLLRLALDSYAKNEDETSLAIITCYINNKYPNMTAKEVTQKMLELLTDFCLENLVKKDLIEYNMETGSYSLKNE